MIFSILDWEGKNVIGDGELDTIWQHSIEGGVHQIANFEGGEFGIGGGNVVPDNDEEEVDENGGGEDHLSWASGSTQNFQRNVPNDAKMAAVLLCDFLGALCILLNAFVIVALIRNRRRVLVNVFYVLVLHCAIVDLIRGGCLIAWGMPHLLIHTMRSIQSRLLALKINQFTLVILRSCNLLTIFNLLVFTTNEFIVIKYPLHYRRYFRRRTVLVILAICWLVSLLFGIGSVFSNFFESAHSVMVLNNETTVSIFRDMDNGEEELSIGSENEGDGEEEENLNLTWEADAERRLMMRFGPQGNEVTRRQLAGLSINVLSMLMIFVLCYVCLFTVLVCYGKILRTIRQFQKCGNGGSRRVLKESMEEGANSNNGKRMGRTGSIYHKRSVHQQRTQQQQCQGTPNSTAARKVEPRATRGEHCAASTDPSERISSLKKKMSSPGSPQSGTSGSADQGCGRCPNCQANVVSDDMNRSRRCNSHRKWRSHLMSRHKYLIVIGTVLFVDILFLFPYSGIQMVALLHLNNLLATSQMTTLIRWGLQILIGVHSVCQPLCYFRMTEFRRLACCLGPSSRRFVGSGSSAGSIFAPPATYSRSAKSIGSIKAFGLTRDEDGSGIVSHKKSTVLGTLVSDGSPLVGNGAIDEAEGDAEKRGGGRRDRTNWVNPSVGERQMLLIAQRRKWTRNLSLLCKEEGEELELFMSREYKRRGEQNYGKPPFTASNENAQHRGQLRIDTVKNRPQATSKSNHPLQKGESLRNRSLEEEHECEPSTLTMMEMEGKRTGKMAAKVESDGKLLDKMCRQRRMLEGNEKEKERLIGTDFGKFEEEKPNDEQKHGNEEKMEENLEQRMESGKYAILLRDNGANNKRDNEERKEQATAAGRIQSLIGRLVGIFGRRRGWPRRARREWAAGEEEEEEEPTLLDSNWKGPGEVHQFRSHGLNETELRPKLSDLSGLRSNSVFTPSNQSACGSCQPSTQWGGSNCGGGNGRRKRSGWNGLSFSYKI